MSHRDVKALADALEQQLRDSGKRKTNLACDSEDEAVLMAHELRKRGWKAEPDQALLHGMQDGRGELKVVNIVRVEKKRARRAG
jgi:hypothetical protein